MKQTNFKNKTPTNLKRQLSLLILATLTTPAFLTACASTNHKDETVEAILAKESSLIEKVKLERASPEVSSQVSNNDGMAKAEVHLTTALNAILEANKVMTDKLLVQQTKGGLSERNIGPNR